MFRGKLIIFYACGCSTYITMHRTQVHKQADISLPTVCDNLRSWIFTLMWGSQLVNLCFNVSGKCRIHPYHHSPPVPNLYVKTGSLLQPQGCSKRMGGKQDVKSAWSWQPWTRYMFFMRMCSLGSEPWGF